MFFRWLGGNVGLFVSWAKSFVGPQICPTPPGHPPGAPTWPPRAMSGFWIRQVKVMLEVHDGQDEKHPDLVDDLLLLCRNFPEHALHEKSLQGQISVGTLVSSDERRALSSR